MRIKNTTLPWILVAGATVVFGLSLYQGALRMWYELGSPFTADSPIYWAVGRGILNGLIPYLDLFETKPPGIFLLSALSFAIFKSPFLGHLLDALSIPLYPLIAGWIAWRESGRAGKSLPFRLLPVLLVATTATVLGLYTLERSGEFQVESFGALFGILYVAMIARKEQLSLTASILAGCFMLSAIGMKEPFLLSLSGAALILSADRPRHLLRAYVFPVIIATCTGILLLAALQYFNAYFHIYLPEVLTQEVKQDHHVWDQVLQWKAIARDLSDFTPLLAGLLGLFVLCPLLEPLKKKRRVLALVSKILLVIGGLYLGLSAVTIKGFFYNHHFAFATPVYMALIVSWAFMLSKKKNHLVSHIVSLGAVVLLVCTVFLLKTQDYAGRLAPMTETTRTQKLLAERIDAALDACNIDRYLFLGTNGPQPYGYTTHSPLGPVFFQLGHFLNPSLPYFRSQFVANLEKAQIIVRQGGEFNSLEPQAWDYMKEHFTSDPWPCAEAALSAKIPSYQFLYRKP